MTTSATKKAPDAFDEMTNAATLMREHHNPGHPRYKMWSGIASWIGEMAERGRNGAIRGNGEWSRFNRALSTAREYVETWNLPDQPEVRVYYGEGRTQWTSVQRASMMLRELERTNPRLLTQLHEFSMRSANDTDEIVAFLNAYKGAYIWDEEIQHIGRLDRERTQQAWDSQEEPWLLWPRRIFLHGGAVIDFDEESGQWKA